jgi:uncharacterized NAD-dependent epimerase/dehydratase family protein
MRTVQGGQAERPAPPDAQKEIVRELQADNDVIGITRNTAGLSDILNIRAQVQPAFDMNVVENLTFPFGRLYAN